VFLNGEKVGAYKDESGEVHAVSVKCPHLGCQLDWNPDEKTWDCPCHGSRFDTYGELISGPAQENLERE
ncbi:MAG: Rieske 2Fe-2S domain-containing protein, partial [Oscillospiraceae bacterium]|nr:Rieske 2Fe-2S domain-containing protein [Oscillospiraceae bacterium]